MNKTKSKFVTENLQKVKSLHQYRSNWFITIMRVLILIALIWRKKLLYRTTYFIVTLRANSKWNQTDITKKKNQKQKLQR